MCIGKRIADRRTYLGFTQEELADKLGYRSKSTITKIEKGINDIPQSKIVLFADALETTPAFLMGWTDDPYNYEEDPDSILSEIPLAQFRVWQEAGLSNREIWEHWKTFSSDVYDEPPATTASDIDPEVLEIAQSVAGLSSEAKKAIWDMIRLMK